MRRWLPFIPVAFIAASAAFAQPVTTKAFSPAKVPPGVNTTVTIVVTNGEVSLSLVAFTDSLPGGLVVANPSVTSVTCTGLSSGSLAAPAGATSIVFSNGHLEPGGSCTINVKVVATVDGVFVNSTGPVASSAGDGAPATATLIAAASPVLNKSFAEVSIGPGSTTALTFNVANSNANVILTGLAFTDVLPAGLVVATPNGLQGSCGGGTITAVAGSNSIALSGATLPPTSICVFRVNVTATGSQLGLVTNTTSTVTSNEALPGAAAIDRLFIGTPYHISYFPNLNLGDSVINITNTGAIDLTIRAQDVGILVDGSSASTEGSMSVNVYTFSPDEQMISCCCCPVTPNGLASLSVREDLISNTLTPAIPSSVVVKLVASRLSAAGTACSDVPSLATLAPGLAAWGTKLHLSPAGVGVTETPFTQATLSASELNRLRTLCAFINANGSGFGICRSCRLGGRGAVGK